MESLYKMDVFISNHTTEDGKEQIIPPLPSPTTSSSYNQAVVDPYASPKRKCQGQTYRERVAIMELSTIDRQVDKYSAMSNNYVQHGSYEKGGDSKEECVESAANNGVKKSSEDKAQVYARIASIYDNLDGSSVNAGDKEKVYDRIGKLYRNVLSDECIVAKDEVYNRIQSIYKSESKDKKIQNVPSTCTNTVGKKVMSTMMNKEQLKVYERISKIYNCESPSSSSSGDKEAIYERIVSIYGSTKLSSCSTNATDKKNVYKRIKSIYLTKTEIPKKDDVYNRIGTVYNAKVSSSTEGIVDVSAVYERVGQLYGNEATFCCGIDKSETYSRVGEIYNNGFDVSTHVDKDEVYGRVGKLYNGGDSIVEHVDKEEVYCRIGKIYNCMSFSSVSQIVSTETKDEDNVECAVTGKDAIYQRICRIYNPDSAASSIIDKEQVYGRIDSIYNPVSSIGEKTLNYNVPLNANQEAVYRRIGGIYRSDTTQASSCVDKEAVYNRVSGIFNSSEDCSFSVNKNDVYQRVGTIYSTQVVSEHNTMPATVEKQNETHPVPKETGDIFSELYAVDLEMDHQKETMVEKDDIQALMELYSVDQKVEKKDLFADDRVKNAFKALFAVDSIVDRKNEYSKNEKNEFIDPITELMLREVGAISTPASKEKCWDVKDILDLLSTDKFVDRLNNLSETNDENILEHLHAVDCEVDDKTRAVEERKDLHDVLDLYQLDQEIESTAKKSVKEATHTSWKTNDMDAIMQLHETDLEVEDARYDALYKSKDGAVFQELYNTDAQVDKIGSKTDTDLKDPFTKSTLSQYAMEAKAVASRADSNICEVMELYSTDIQVGAAKSHRAIQGTEEALTDLYENDKEIEQRNAALTNVETFEEVNTIEEPCENKKPVKRSIFTAEEKMKASKSEKNLYDRYQIEESLKKEEVAVKANESFVADDDYSVDEEVKPRRKGFFRSIFSKKEKRAAERADRFTRRS